VLQAATHIDLPAYATIRTRARKAHRHASPVHCSPFLDGVLNPMILNDVLRSIRYMLDLSDAMVIDIVHLADPTFVVERDEVRAMLLREDEPGHVQCTDAVLARVLDGLIVHRRGRDERQPARPIETRLTNNLVMKKLRIAFELNDADMHDVFSDAGFPVSKPELSALFRQPAHRNYRPCGDQMLRNFLKGLTLRVRGGGDA
jgi:uncharacterized protein YehS (DUF1456 family)